MESVFDAPLASIECEDSLGGSLDGGQAGNTVDRFRGVLVFPEMRYFPADTEDLTHIREFQVIVQLFADPDRADFYASVAFVSGLIVRWGVVEMQIFDVGFEGWLVIFDREHIVRFFFPRPGIGPFRVGYAGHQA